MRRSCYSLIVVCVGLLLCRTSVSAWSGVISRRRWFVQSTTVASAAVAIAPSAGAASSTAALLEELRISKEKMQPIPSLLEDKEWDKVRSILKLPPVNKLWNLGDSQNIVLQLARETGDVDLIELKEDIAYNLQMCDQLTYDNAFVYYQPGNGKFKIKEPQQLVTAAMKQIQEAIDLSNK